MHNLIIEELHRVQCGETTPIAAANTIANWCEEEINNTIEKDGWRKIVEEEEEQLADLQYAAFTTGTPDMFSNEMRGFWNA